METLLFVEDDVHQAELYRQELEEDGYEVVLAHEGLEALQEVLHYRFDLLILDISLPGIDGVEVLGKILALNSSVPVIIYTAYDEYKNDFMTWTAEHYITKSSNLSELKSKIREVLDGRAK
jgi:DNA-binding response OmpR family regulator